MKVGICHKQGSFSDTWIKYCQEHGISYQLVDAYRYDIIDQLKGCNVFMWHFAHHDYRDMLMARPLLNAVERGGFGFFRIMRRVGILMIRLANSICWRL